MGARSLGIVVPTGADAMLLGFRSIMFRFCLSSDSPSLLLLSLRSFVLLPLPPPLPAGARPGKLELRAHVRLVASRGREGPVRARHAVDEKAVPVSRAGGQRGESTRQRARRRPKVATYWGFDDRSVAVGVVRLSHLRAPPLLLSVRLSGRLSRWPRRVSGKVSW